MRRLRKNEAATVEALYQLKSIQSSLKVTENVWVFVNCRLTRITWMGMWMLWTSVSRPGMPPSTAPCGAGSSSMGIWESGRTLPPFISNSGLGP